MSTDSRPRGTAGSRLRALGPSRVTILDGFLAERQRVNRERTIEVEWMKDDTQSSYSVTLSVLTENRQGLLADGVLAVSLVEDERPVYGPMSLAPE